jgi:branched-chain amino acid transport system substrate-binding protein
MTKLVEQDKVDAVIGPFPQFVESAARAVTEKAGVPNVMYIPPTLASEKDTSFKWTFLCTAGPTPVSEALVKLMTAEGYKNVVAIADNLSIHQESLTLLKTSAPAAGITIDVMSDTWGLEETDTSAVVAKLAAEVKAKSPDAILVLSNPIHAPGIQKQLRALGVKQQIIGSPAGTSPAMFMQGPQDAEGMLAIGTGTVNAKALPDDFKPKADMVAFNDRFAAANKGQPADFYAGFGYDSLYIVLNAMKAAGGTDKAAVRDAIEKTTGWQGMQGIFNYSATDHVGVHGGLAEWRIKNGGFEFVRDLTLGQ